jgi:hypothetical protein
MMVNDGFSLKMIAERLEVGVSLLRKVMKQVDIQPHGPRRMTTRQRFESHVDRSAGSVACHEYRGARDQRGYGKFPKGTHGAGWTAAHRVAWELEVGPIPDGFWVLHHCDNPPCVNVKHLFLGDSDINVADMVAKRRHRPQGRMPVHIGERQRRLAKWNVQS